MDLVLASASPRRSAILSQLGYEFRVEPSECDENLDGIAPLDAPAILAERKALEISRRFPSATVLGYDTLVFLDGQALGKPSDMQDARRMLSSLRGRSHQVGTGIALCRQGICLYADQEFTQVRFREFTEGELLDYIDTLEPMDKAGAYGIQGRGARLVHSIEGCYYNVVGLPVAKTIEVLSRI